MLGNALYWFWEQGVSPEICEILINKTPWDQSQRGSTKHGRVDAPAEYDQNIRMANVVWVDPNSVAGAITQSFIRQANAAADWNFSVDSFEPVQMTKYDGSVLGHHDWHMDTIYMNAGKGGYRKLTCILLLNDPSTFEGGELLLKTGGPAETIPLKQGSVIVFPSFMYHKVNPVTSGTRYTAVNWALGPAFK